MHLCIKFQTRTRFDDTPERVPFYMVRKLNINYTKFEDRHYWILQPKTGATDKVVFYVHGGAYVQNMISFQWFMVGAIISRTNATFIIPDYDLAPRWTYTKLFSFIKNLYLHVLEKNAPEKVYLLGDSAGSGFILSFAMSLRDMKLPLPSKIFMVSPWVDLSMTNQDCYKNDKVDTMTSISGLIQAAKLFAGDIDLKDPRISPLYGNLHNLPNISMYDGTHDVLNPDVRLLRDRFQKENIPLNYYEFPHMFHCFPAVPFLREAKVANQNIADAILE